MEKKIVQRGRPQRTIQRRRTAWWITKATHTRARAHARTIC